MSGSTMLSKQQGQRSFGNGALRDQWEKRAQSVADQCKQEAEWKEKSSLKVLFSKWNYHWSLVANGDKMAAEESEFSRVTSRTDEAEKKPKIRFKIIPPPPKPKPEPLPPVPPPPPRRSASPRRRRPKRKVEVDVFRLCWRESWMSLKPPKYLYLKARESGGRRPKLSHIELIRNTNYKPAVRESAPLASKWSHSWKQVKSPVQQICSEDKRFLWDTLWDRKLVRRAEIGQYSLPVWAGTWKIMSFPFRQQKKNWDGGWPNYHRDPSDASDKFHTMDQQKAEEEPWGWEDSWKLSGAETVDITDDETNSDIRFPTRINHVSVPGWRNSYSVSDAPPEEDEERHKSWSSCWGFRQQIRWRRASLTAHHCHAAALDRKRKHTNLFLTSELHDEDFTEWTEAWKTTKSCVRPEEKEEDVHNEDVGTEEEEEAGNGDEDEAKHIKEFCKKTEEEDEEEDMDKGVEEEEDEDEIKYNEEENEEDENVKEEEEENTLDKQEEGEEENQEYEEEKDKEENLDPEETKDDEDEKDEEENLDLGETKDDEDEEKPQKEKKINIEQEEKTGDEDEEFKDLNEDEGRENEDEKDDDDDDAEEDGEESDINQEREDDDEDEDEGHEENVDNEEEENEEVYVDEFNKKQNLKKDEDDEEEEEDEDNLKKDEDDEEEEEDEDNLKKNENDEDKEEEEADNNDEDEEQEEEEVHGGEVREEQKQPKKKRVKTKPDAPLHLQFHKLNVSFSSWRRSWMVAVVHGGEEEEEEDWELRVWRESWRICWRKKMDEDGVECFSMEHRSQRSTELKEEDRVLVTDWTLSWRLSTRRDEEEKEES